MTAGIALEDGKKHKKVKPDFDSLLRDLDGKAMDSLIQDPSKKKKEKKMPDGIFKSVEIEILKPNKKKK